MDGCPVVCIVLAPGAHDDMYHVASTKVGMTCPEFIDMMATEDLWVSPGGKSSSKVVIHLG